MLQRDAQEEDLLMSFHIDSKVDFVEDQFLTASLFCDCQNNLIRQAVGNIVRNCSSSREQARRVFYWVRDSIKYELGLNQDKASDTLQKGAGSCTNKANLLVAMLRSLGIPAGFHTMYVKGKDYLGVFCTPTFNVFMGARSLHTYCSVRLEGRWIRLDPTDDIRLSNGTQHLCPQGSTIDFDGHGDARLRIDPAHVLEDTGQLLPSPDEIFMKKKQVPDVVITVFNLYLDFLRHNCIWYSDPMKVEVDFLAWLRQHNASHCEEYMQLLESVRSRP
jgi:hypothetical protein